MWRNGHLCAGVPLRNYSLTHSFWLNFTYNTAVFCYTVYIPCIYAYTALLYWKLMTAALSHCVVAERPPANRLRPNALYSQDTGPHPFWHHVIGKPKLKFGLHLSRHNAFDIWESIAPPCFSIKLINDVRRTISISSPFVVSQNDLFAYYTRQSRRSADVCPTFIVVSRK